MRDDAAGSSRHAEEIASRLSQELTALGAALEGIERRLVDGSRRVAETDGRLERELDLMRDELGSALSTLRDDVAAAIAEIRGTVELRLAEAPNSAALGALEARVAALEAATRTPVADSDAH